MIPPDLLSPGDFAPNSTTKQAVLRESLHKRLMRIHVGV